MIARILRWLDLRFRTGFSEWLSHVYYDEDLTDAEAGVRLGLSARAVMTQRQAALRSLRRRLAPPQAGSEPVRPGPATPEP